MKWIRDFFKRVRRLFFGDGRAVYYIGGSETLPPSLSAEKERELLLRLAAGDERARAKLIEHNLRLVVYVAR